MPGDPLVLYCSGIPVDAETLDLGTSTTQQLNALSSFSQMVNALSTSSEVWSPGGTETWTVYELVLTQSELAQSTPPRMMLEPYEECLREAAHAIPTSLHAVLSPRLEATGFHFLQPPQGLAESALPPLHLEAPGQTLASTFDTLEAELHADRMADARGAVFCPTYLYPPNFTDSAYDALWVPFEITPGRSDPWLPVGDHQTLRGEMIVLPLQRSWWSPWIFSSRGWRFAPASGLPQLSDGGSPPSGLMPFYVSSVILARNVTIVSDSRTTAPAAAAFFTLKSETPRSYAPLPMSIIGFHCTTIPLCPNPDPALNWEDATRAVKAQQEN